MTENFVSVDIEAGGASMEYNLCSIGACEVGNTKNGFYIELKPLFPDTYKQEALDVGGFTIQSMERNGAYPYNAMVAFESWLNQFDRPVAVGFGMAFDWAFVNGYFHKFLGRNILGINGICIKSLYMGMTGCEYKKTTKRSIPKKYHSDKPHTHNALDDAISQSELFSNILKEIRDV